jgi:membrane-associated phospholipid phosphatase
MSILFEFGEYGPILLTILSWYLLWNNKNMFFYYNVGLFANSITNIILKGIIQEPRPMYDNKKMYLLTNHAKNYFYQNGIPFNMFGMPSGHAQTSFFSTAFIYFALRHNNIFFLYLASSILTCYQRVSLDYHTIYQIIVGAIVGSSFARFVYQLAREKIKGIIKGKPDDFGPV